jgi:hypothetical protein
MVKLAHFKVILLEFCLNTPVFKSSTYATLYNLYIVIIYPYY